jgi:predicted PurR-regulated permease PerM
VRAHLSREGLWGGVIVGSVDNVLRPWVVGAGEKQHPVVIALAAIGGTFAFGPLGIILGPLVVSLLAALLREMQELVWPHLVAPRPLAASPPRHGQSQQPITAIGE